MGNASPEVWARDKRRKAKRYATDRYVPVLTRARDVAMPGTPLAVLIGVACNNGDEENTTGWIAGNDAERAEALAKTPPRKPLGGDPAKGYGHVRSDDLHELGRFGVEGGHCPTPVATDNDCPWVVLARGETVDKILGREGVTGAAWYGAIDDQVAIGVADLALHAHEVWKRLDPRLRWEEDGDGGPKAWTLWPVFCGVNGWSAGNGGIERHVERYTAELAALPPSHRVGDFLRRAGLVDDPGNRHKADEWTGLRWSQKREGMIEALKHTGEGEWARRFLDDGLSDAERPAVYARLVETCT